MLFVDPKDEDRLCQVFRAYFEEWGPGHVIISVPEHWSNYSMSAIKGVRLKCETKDSVALSVENDDAIILRFEMRLSLGDSESSEKVCDWHAEALENRLFRVALKYLNNHYGCQRQSAVLRVISADIRKRQTAALLREFELKFGHAEPNEIAYWLIQHLVSAGFIEIRQTSMLLLTGKGRSWLLKQTVPAG